MSPARVRSSSFPRVTHHGRPGPYRWLMTHRAWLVRWGDALLAAAVLAVLVIELSLHPGTPPAAYLAAALAAAPLSLRRRVPVIACLLAMAGMTAMSLLVHSFMNTSFGMLAVVVIALYSMGRHARGVEAGLAVAVVLAAIVAFLYGDQPPPYDPADIAFAVLFIGGPWAAGLAVRLRADRVRHLSLRNDQLARESEEHARQAVANERARIARELHDVVSHAIAVTVLQARGARRTVGIDDAQVTSALDAIVDTNTAALGDMRRLLALLRDAEDPTLDASTTAGAPQPSLLGIGELVEAVRRSGVQLELTTSGSPEGVPPGVDLTAYRVVQEALTNVIRHAGSGAHAHVDLAFGEHELTVLVTDDGPVAPSSPAGNGSGNGLIGIRERMAVVGGRVEAGPLPTGGFRLRAWLPYAIETIVADPR